MKELQKPVKMFHTAIPTAQKVEFVRAFPTQWPALRLNLPLREDPQRWPRSTKDIYNSRFDVLILRDSPRVRGVLIKGVVYSDDRIFWMDGFLESRERYPLVYEKPESSDQATLRRDEFYGVKYASDFPAAEDLDLDTQINYTNGESWDLERRQQIEYCQRKDEEERERYLDLYVDDNDPDFLRGLQVAMGTQGVEVDTNDPRFPDLLRVLRPKFLYTDLKRRMRDLGRDYREEVDSYRDAAARHTTETEPQHPVPCETDVEEQVEDVISQIESLGFLENP